MGQHVLAFDMISHVGLYINVFFSAGYASAWRHKRILPSAGEDGLAERKLTINPSRGDKRPQTETESFSFVKFD